MKVSGRMQGKRLDQVLSEHPFCVGMGLRGRRRLCEEGNVLVNGRERAMSYKVFDGQDIEIKEVNQNSTLDIEPSIIKESADYIAFYKPKNLPTVILSGKLSLSLESFIPSLTSDEITLLNRLDTITSGIVLGAKNLEALERYRKAQEASLVTKKYLALAEGILTQETTVKWALDTTEPKVAIMPWENPEQNQHTQLKPLEIQGENTLVQCTIYKGQRHQIRAHIASCGHPLVGDSIYGAKPILGVSPYLCHFSLEFEDFQVVIPQ